MYLKSCLVVIGLCAALIMGHATSAEARGFGGRGGSSVRLGVGRTPSRSVRYYGPSFAGAPNNNRSYGQGSTQFQQRPWYYSQSGPYKYYRPYRPLYTTR